MLRTTRNLLLWAAMAVMLLEVVLQSAGASEQLADTVERVKPSIVGVGTFAEIRRPPAQIRGTGFVVGGGDYIATNEHVIAPTVDAAMKERLVVFVGKGRDIEVRAASVVALDKEHDLALLSYDGARLPALQTSSRPVREGTSIAFTGFPLGAMLGLHPVTSQGIVSALTPIAIPAQNSTELSTDKLLALRDPYDVLQLDATAYPGNSGSPVYIQASGAVIGIVNQVFVKGRKEDILRDPSAITYAIPVHFLEALLASRASVRN